MAIADFFNSTVTIQKATATTSGMGGVSESYSTRISGLVCRMSRKRLQGPRPEETQKYGKVTVEALWILYCAATTETLAIIETDRVVHGSKTLQVKGIYNPGDLDRHLEIDCLEIS